MKIHRAKQKQYRGLPLKTCKVFFHTNEHYADINENLHFDCIATRHCVPFPACPCSNSYAQRILSF